MQRLWNVQNNVFKGWIFEIFIVYYEIKLIGLQSSSDLEEIILVILIILWIKYKYNMLKI